MQKTIETPENNNLNKASFSSPSSEHLKAHSVGGGVYFLYFSFIAHMFSIAFCMFISAYGFIFSGGFGTSKGLVATFLLFVSSLFAYWFLFQILPSFVKRKEKFIIFYKKFLIVFGVIIAGLFALKLYNKMPLFIFDSKNNIDTLITAFFWGNSIIHRFFYLLASNVSRLPLYSLDIEEIISVSMGIITWVISLYAITRPSTIAYFEGASTLNPNARSMAS